MFSYYAEQYLLCAAIPVQGWTTFLCGFLHFFVFFFCEECTFWPRDYAGMQFLSWCWCGNIFFAHNSQLYDFHDRAFLSFRVLYSLGAVYYCWQMCANKSGRYCTISAYLSLFGVKQSDRYCRQNYCIITHIFFLVPRHTQHTSVVVLCLLVFYRFVKYFDALQSF